MFPTHLLAVIGGIGVTHQVVIGPAVQVGVLPADEAVPCVADLTVTLVHGVAEVAEVHTVCVPVAVMGLILAGVLRLTHLGSGEDREERKKKRQSYTGLQQVFLYQFTTTNSLH